MGMSRVTQFNYLLFPPLPLYLYLILPAEKSILIDCCGQSLISDFLGTSGACFSKIPNYPPDLSENERANY